MSDPFKNPNRFRELLREAVQVTVVNDKGKVLRKQKVEDDNLDELLWAVDKYSWRPITSKGKLTQASLSSIRTVAEQLVNPSQVDRLIEVVSPWRQLGFDALRRIYEAQSLTNVPFPFFKYTIPTPANDSKSSDDSMIKWPTTPNPQSVNDIYNMSSYARGRGELLLCLMTGGIRSGSGGDFRDPQGKLWEVKQSKGPHHKARLGEATSKAFIEKRKTMSDDKALAAAFTSAGIAGLLFVSGDGVKTFSTSAALFHSLLSNERVEITIKGPKDEKDKKPDDEIET